MIADRQILSETWQPEGFCLRVERVQKPDFEFFAITDDTDTDEVMKDMEEALKRSPEFMELETAYTLAGDYIGDIERARRLCGEYGIKPEKSKPDHSVCSIGFSEAEQKWYGWSHRAMRGFGIGSSVKRGDSGYVPVDMTDACDDAVRFWADEYHVKTEAFPSVDADGRQCIRVEWTYTNTVPNPKLRGEKGGTTSYPPQPFGRGEWTAETLDDAKQMAADFAEGVS